MPAGGTHAYRLFFERSAEPIWLLEPATGRVLDCNQALADLLQSNSRAELIGREAAELLPAAQDAAALLTGAREAGGTRFEAVMQRVDGRPVPVEIVATAVPMGKREVLFLLSRDITRRLSAEAAAREHQRLLASVADNIREAIFRSGPDHRLVFVNRAYLQLFRYDSLEELQAIPRERLYADPARRPALLEALGRRGFFQNEEAQYVRKDGTRFWGLASAVAIRDPATGETSYHVGSIIDVTERKQAADAIRELNATLERRVAERTAELSASEARLRTLVEHAPEAILVFDGESGRFLTCNENAVRLYGLPREQLLLRTPAEVSPEFQPDGRPSAVAAREWMDRALAGETPVFEWTHRHTNGRLLTCEVRLVRLPGEGLKLVRGSVTDHTERKRQERVKQAIHDISEAVRRADDLPTLYRHIHATVRTLMPANNFYIALREPGSELFAFPYFTDEHDPPPQPMTLTDGLSGVVIRTGEPLLVNPATPITHLPARKAVLHAAGRAARYTEVGSPAAVWLGVPLTIRGQTIGVMAVQDYRDPAAYGEAERELLAFVAKQTALAIERKRAEQSLRESEQKFRALFQASSQGVMLHDEHGYLEVNAAAARILGYDDPAQLLGKHPSDTSPPTQPGGETSDTLARRYIAECLGRGSARFEWVATSARGEDVPLEVILTHIPMGGRDIIQAVINNISARKQAEAELLRSLARETELGQLKSNFVSMVSHEFRTPLGIIMSSAEILRDYLEKLELADRQQHLQSIQQNTRRMAELMEEVLLLGRFDAGKMDFQPAPLDLPQLCQRITDDVWLATDRVCPISLDLGAGLGNARADERLLRHIFTNLLSNAVKYSPAGSPVEFRVTRAGAEALCVVRDRGIGIPEADREWVCTPFHRGRNVGDRPGSGLGLVIVKRCVELHGGRLHLESRPAAGTTATVRLPVFAAPEGAVAK